MSILPFSLWEPEFQAFCVGLPKTGTTSMARIFKRYRSGHEVWFAETVTRVMKYRKGLLHRDALERFILRRIRENGLEMDSASFNHLYKESCTMNNLNPDIIRPYHAFNRENTWYVINRDRFVYEQVPESFVRFLKDLEKNPNLPIPQAHQERLIRLKLRRASNPPKAPRPKPAEVFEPPVATATIFVTQQCNHDCIYCYGGGGEYGDPGIMEDEIGLKTLDWLWAQRGDLKSLAVSFSGGEPLLNFELIRRMVDHAHQLETQGDARFKFTVATNAALLNDRVLDFMETHDIYALIGFDGPREIQDRNRPLRNGRSSYGTVLPRIQKLIANMPERVTLRASIWQKGDIPRVVNEMRKLGPRIFQTPIASPGGHLGEGAREPTSTWEDPVAALSAAIPDFLKVLHQRDLATLKSFSAGLGSTNCSEFCPGAPSGPAAAAWAGRSSPFQRKAPSIPATALWAMNATPLVIS